MNKYQSDSYDRPDSDPRDEIEIDITDLTEDGEIDWDKIERDNDERTADYMDARE